ncbi:TlpA family protein disulfide reductase [Fusobacterium canifelinum]|uniref:TlpA family protein disulfide reductase n=1 Tax=Fusobacterium canifelinum TaxID=285729 RepID=A0A7T4KFS0_9FUSO|nr:TlpA disulfide reductase family protein [Fusobacterium canifelinum]QQB73089.1 TlpA family protein disulfide reductase [Fusobacterium canifelinum]
MKKKILILLLFILSLTSFAVPLNNMDKDGNVTLPNIELVDQYGKKHNLQDYKGKVIMLNFWVSWCSDCKAEMPKVVELYKEYGENKKDLIILGVATPISKEYPNNKDRIDKEALLKYIKDNGYIFPNLLDETGKTYAEYEVIEYPSTYIIDKNGYLKVYVKGAVSKEELKKYIESVLNPIQK